MSASDLWGDLHVVAERRLGGAVPVLLGRPWPVTRGGAKVIVTADLADHLRRHNRRGAPLDLPVGKGAIARVRKLLGLTVDSWWQEREADLAALTGLEFAQRHGCSQGAASLARRRLLGISRKRPEGWWREPEPRAALLSDAPRAVIADQLGVSVGAIGRLRWLLEREGHTPSAFRRAGRPAHPRTAEALRKAASRRKRKAHREAIGRAGHHAHLKAWSDSRPASWPVLEAAAIQSLAIRPDPGRGRRWTSAELALLGLAPDSLVASVLGRSVASVTQARQRRGVSCWRPRDN